MVGWLVNWFNSQLVGVRVTVRVDVPGHRGAADFKVPRKFVPRPGSRADVESDLPATRP